MEAYGKGGQRALTEFGALKNLARLYWYTVEFGLIRQPAGLRIYGSGIVSSRAESIYAVENPSPNRVGFDLERVMRTDYRIDDFQESYFVIDSFDALFAETYKDFAALYQKLATGPTFKPGDVLASDRVDHRGTHTISAAATRRSNVPRRVNGWANWFVLTLRVRHRDSSTAASTPLSVNICGRITGATAPGA